MGERQTGVVVSVEGPIVGVRFEYQEDLPPLCGMMETKSLEGRKIILEVVEHLEENIAHCISLDSTLNLRKNSVAEVCDIDIKVPVGEGLFGRVINLLGRPLDKKGKIESSYLRSIHRPNLPPILNSNQENKTGVEILETGIKAIDFLFPLAKGSKTGILGGAALGKSILTLELIHNIVRKQTGVCIFTGIGERIREGNELYYEFLRHGILDKVIMLFAQMNEPPGARFEAALSGITQAEYFEEANKDVLFFMDNIYRFVQAGAEVSTLLGRVPSEVGYQPTLISEVSSFHERIRSRAGGGSITAIETVYVPADDLTDPAVVTIFSYLDSIMVLSREKIQRGLYPAIDFIKSSSSMLDAQVVGKRHYTAARETLKLLIKYEELRRIAAVIGFEELSTFDRTLYQRAKKLENFLTQPFFTAEVYTGREGKGVVLGDTLKGCEKIIAGETDKEKEESFYMIGKWEEA
ncbi:MAG: F0F1 ATP synthase subunit beta [Candidatus Omnitrophica bacterium]|nr:F0F1 ATP synthase subunit beta [Candidatus Omnitrophota bacterium]MBU0897356.1 F0F1 ATP synthase subunit beta [Candidatus Omnitrophota bacterium]MBU1133420.1 F0F1 ATP synthase subunit beta [Candidatus Omnitrophota bacterium]MBU1366802.1 F0F1 ATP synthase subunit beta [Candidatus Omnitrophota bacterium]MBU1524090.1 F0F1 ATP synthase subunit beta [Candidatus Omnitrophota bacterium]